VTGDAPLLDTTTLSEVMRGGHAGVLQRSQEYRQEYGRFRFSIITRYEILRGLKAKVADRQAQRFEDRCRESEIFPLSDRVVVQAAEVYAALHRTGRLISDADILIAATALVHGLILVTENSEHFERISGLEVQSWRSS
jgi:tRNA(fMet)-specific endonuclease VapC